MSDFNAIQNTLNEIKRALEAKNIFELRQIGRAVGVFRPTDMKKGKLIDDVMAIAQNELDPTMPNKRGAPAKSKDYDKDLADKILYCRDVLSGAISVNPPTNMLEVNQKSPKIKMEDATFFGTLQSVDCGAYLRTENFYLTPKKDVFISSEIVSEYDLRSGDKVTVKAIKNKNGVGFTAVSVVSVNGVRPDMVIRRPHFNDFTPCYGEKTYKLSLGENNLTTRLIDLFAPIAFGSRALVVAPSKSGKTTLLKTIAKAVKKAEPNSHVIYVSIDERPEEVTEIINELDGVEVVYSTFDTDERNHVNTAILATERAKRFVEEGKDAVLILDDLARLVKATNAQVNEKSALTGGLLVNAFMQAKKLLGSARNVKNGASLTVIASCEMQAENGVDVMYSQFKDAANTEIVLNKNLSQNKIYPAIDIVLSGTRKEEKFLSNEEISLSIKLKNLIYCGTTYTQIHGLFNETQSNAELLANSQKLIGEIK